MQVAVVGAGFAGLAAALELSVTGNAVTVFEARDRVGGRVWSTRMAGSTIERGAEFVLEGYDVMRAYAAALGLGFADTGMSYYAREPRGGAPVTPAALASAAARVRAALATASENTTVSALLDTVPLDDGSRQAIAARASISSAWPAEDLAAAALADVANGYAARSTFRLAAGNQALAVGLAGRVVDAGGRVALANPVRSITWAAAKNSRVVVRTERDEHEVDVVVVAVPLAVLEDIAFEPGLPIWKLEALRQCAAGQAAKLHVPLVGGWGIPTSAVLSVPDRFWCWTATDGSGTTPPLVNCFAGSWPALERLGIDQGPGRWLSRLAHLRPDLRLDVPGAILTTWHDDRWAGMAYSAHAAGRRPDPATCALPVGRLYFAGEHTAVDHGGLMEGALRSGKRAAAEINATAFESPADTASGFNEPASRPSLG